MPNQRKHDFDPSRNELVGWFNGVWIHVDEIRYSRNDLGVVQGVTAVERLRTYRGKLWQVDRHLARLVQSANEAMISSVSLDKLAKLVGEIPERNRRHIEENGDIGVSVIVTPGDATTESRQPTIGVYPSEIDHQVVQQRRLDGQSVVITSVVQPPSESWSRQAKLRSRIHYFRADKIARTSHNGAIGVLVDSDGTVTEASTCNLALVKDRAIFSPQASQVLGGITQSVVEDLAAQAGFNWSKQRIHPDELRAADEVLLMGTTTGLWYANRVDEVAKSIPKDSVYESLRKRFNELTQQTVS